MPEKKFLRYMKKIIRVNSIVQGITVSPRVQVNVSGHHVPRQDACPRGGKMRS